MLVLGARLSVPHNLWLRNLLRFPSTHANYPPMTITANKSEEAEREKRLWKNFNNA